ncbi:MAG: hypothetical protein K5836_03390 [Clostridiales bacterium]|nr:hypothetical protein [Clostridiales bacterium]
MKKTVLSFFLALLLMVALFIPAFAFSGDKYAVDYTIKTETGIQKLFLPAMLIERDGNYFAELVFNDPEVDKLYLGNAEILPTDTIKSPYRNYTGKYNVFELPIAALGEDTEFVLHTRGNNLQTDKYVINMPAFDQDFDAAAQLEAVKADNFGAQPLRFYGWHVGMSSSLWGPFVFLAVEALAIYVIGKKLGK